MSSVDKPISISKPHGIKFKSKGKSRNSKVSVGGTSSVSFCNNFNPNIQIVIPSTKHVKQISRVKVQTVHGKRSAFVLGKTNSRKKGSSRNSYSVSSKYSHEGGTRHSTFSNIAYNCPKF